MSVLDLAAGSGFAYVAGTGTPSPVVVPGNCSVKVLSLRAATGAPATFTIAPKGAGQTGTAGDTVTVPAGAGFAEDFLPGQLGEGSIITITDSDAYYVSFFVGPGGAQ